MLKSGHFVLKVDGRELFNEKLKMTTVDPDGKVKGHVYNIQELYQLLNEQEVTKFRCVCPELARASP